MRVPGKLSRLLVWLSLVACPGLAGAQGAADVGLINQLAGEASYQGGAGSRTPAQAYMRVRQGDRFSVTAGAALSIVYFQGGRQEKWQGPASLRAGVESSELISGKAPVVSKLPVAVPEKIARIPDLLQGAKLGGISVRGATSRRPPGPMLEQVRQAQLTYKEMRSQAAADDVTPELYLLSVFQEHGYIDEMGPVAEELMRRQPQNAEMGELARWALARANAPK